MTEQKEYYGPEAWQTQPSETDANMLAKAREALWNIRKMIAGRAKTNTMGGQVIIDGMLFELIDEEIDEVLDGKPDDNL